MAIANITDADRPDSSEQKDKERKSPTKNLKKVYKLIYLFGNTHLGDKNMRLGLKYAVLTVICGLFLMSTVVLAQSSSIVFPEVEDWEKGDITTYPSPDLGYSVPYQSEIGGTVTIYVYNGGFKTIANGVDDENVKRTLKSAEDEIKKYGELGYYDDVKRVKNGTVSLGGPSGTTKSLYSLFSFKIRGTEVDSEIYLFGYQNSFIKIRATRPKGTFGPENEAVDALLMNIGLIFRQ